MVKEEIVITRTRGEFTIPKPYRKLMGINGKTPLKLILNEKNELHIRVIKS